MHESGVWSEVHKKWFFLPRKASKEKYESEHDEHSGANVLITCDETFTKIEAVEPFGPTSTNTTHGFSSFKFVPGTNDQYIIALKSTEVGDSTDSYVMVFDLNGNLMMEETKLEGDFKYEGLEFI